MAEFAKWSIVSFAGCMLLLGFWNLARSGRRGAPEAVGALIGLLIYAWVVVAVCVWWRP